MAEAMTLQAGRGGKTWFQKHVRTSSKMHKAIKAEDKVQFFQQLTTLFAAGTPLLDALNISSEQSQSLKMRSVIRTIAERVAGGASLHQAAADFPKVFDRQWVEVISTGELSGQLADVLTSLTEHIVMVREMRSKIVSAMIYPCILTVVAVLAVFVMLWKVVPTFASFFDEFDAEMPAITQTVLDVSDYLQHNALMLIGGVAGLVVGLRFYLRTDGGRRVFSQVILTVPLLGECAVQAYMEKFATNMLLLLKSGLPLLDAIGSMQGVFHGNVMYREAFKRIEQRVAGGTALAPAMEESRLFTSMVISMVRVGEESGEMAAVLNEISTYYRKKVGSLIERLTSMVEPIVILGMGVTIAVILTAIYLPMFQMAGGVH